MKHLFMKYRDIVLYGIFGVLTTLVNIITYHVSYNTLGISNVGSTIIAWIFAVTFAFLTNKTLVFESRSWNRNTVVAEICKFYGCRISTGVIEVGMMYLFVDMMGMNGTLMKTITNVIVIILNYIFSKLFIFKKAA